MLFFFFKQKTAYEMRISDWSSDVCSSDLRRRSSPERGGGPCEAWWAKSACLADEITRYGSVAGNAAHSVQRGVSRLCPSRSEERRVGKECVSTCKSRGSPDP